MRATLLTAQRMADSIVREAEGKRDEILAKAEAGAQEKIARYQQELAAAEDRLKQGQQELARFIAASREICDKELQFLEQLPQLPVETEQPAPAEAPVEEIEEKVMAAFSAQQPEEAPEEQPAPETPADDYPEGDPFAREEPLEATRRINLDDLKFGRNYGGES